MGLKKAKWHVGSCREGQVPHEPWGTVDKTPTHPASQPASPWSPWHCDASFPAAADSPSPAVTFPPPTHTHTQPAIEQGPWPLSLHPMQCVWATGPPGTVNSAATPRLWPISQLSSLLLKEVLPYGYFSSPRGNQPASQPKLGVCASVMVGGCCGILSPVE